MVEELGYYWAIENWDIKDLGAYFKRSAVIIDAEICSWYRAVGFDWNVSFLSSHETNYGYIKIFDAKQACGYRVLNSILDSYSHLTAQSDYIPDQFEIDEENLLVATEKAIVERKEEIISFLNDLINLDSRFHFETTKKLHFYGSKVLLEVVKGYKVK